MVLDINGEDESPEIGSPPIRAKQKVRGRQYIIDCLMNVTKTYLGESTCETITIDNYIKNDSSKCNIVHLAVKLFLVMNFLDSINPINIASLQSLLLQYILDDFRSRNCEK